jgi:hypothetical protein
VLFDPFGTKQEAAVCDDPVAYIQAFDDGKLTIFFLAETH